MGDSHRCQPPGSIFFEPFLGGDMWPLVSPVNLRRWIPASQSKIRRVLPTSFRSVYDMLSTLASDSNDLVSLFTGNDHGHSSHLDNGSTCSSDAMSPASNELSDDSSLTTDDLVVLSDLFGFVTPGSNSSSGTQGTSRPRSRKRPRVTKSPSEDGSALPKSQQQRQKQEIAFLKSQVVELQATVEELQTRKLERERQTLERRAQLNERNSFDNASAVNEWGIAECQAAAVQQLAEQNEMLHIQVATHLGQLKQLEQIARTRYLANAFPEQKQQLQVDV